MISAAFFRERAPAGAPSASDSRAKREAQRDDDLAATGIGRGVDHPVTQVWLDLESSPAAMVNVRYEYRAALVSLGVFPQYRDPMQRREQASGFCPVP